MDEIGWIGMVSSVRVSQGELGALSSSRGMLRHFFSGTLDLASIKEV